MCGCGRTSMPRPAARSTGPKWSRNTNGPTCRRKRNGSKRRTTKPSPRSCRRGSMTRSDARVMAIYQSTNGHDAIAGRRRIGANHNRRKQKGRGASTAAQFRTRRLGSGRRHVLGLQAFLALHDSETDLLPFLQRTETGAADRTKMHEHIRSVLTADEAEALAFVEPLNGTDLTIRHGTLHKI